MYSQRSYVKISYSHGTIETIHKRLLEKIQKCIEVIENVNNLIDVQISELNTKIAELKKMDELNTKFDSITYLQNIKSLDIDISEAEIDELISNILIDEINDKEINKLVNNICAEDKQIDGRKKRTRKKTEISQEESFYNRINYANLTKQEMIEIQEQLVNIESRYKASIASILLPYYDNQSYETEMEITEKYSTVVLSENYISYIEMYIRRLNVIIDCIIKNKPPNPSKNYKNISNNLINNIKRELNYLSEIEIPIGIEAIEYDLCSCGTKMNSLAHTSLLECENCGEVKSLQGTILNEDQAATGDNQKAKHGSYDPGRHYRFWMQRIQATENKVFPEKDLKKLKDYFERDGIKPIDINCELMRDYLKETKLTNHNDHTPLLVKIFTGKSPPQLNYKEFREATLRFTLIMDLYEHVKSEEQFNRKYYPYFIYKILDDMFEVGHPKRKLLECIHLQSDETVTENDLLYERICDLSDGRLVYKSTF